MSPAPHPTPSEQAERVLAHPNGRRVLEVLAGAPEGGLAHRELIAATGLTKNTITKWTRAAAAGGLLSSSRQGVRLLARGALALAHETVPRSGPVGLGAAIARWPTVEQQAFLRLGLAEVVARQLFGEQRPGDLLGLVALGAEVGTGKTQAGLFLARVVGLADELALCRLPARAPGEILGRLEQRPGRRVFTPAARLAHPLVVLDEFDKADGERRAVALACLDNGYRFEREGELHEQRAVPMLTANKDIALPAYAARRAIVLDHDPLASRGELAGMARLAGELAELHRQGAFPTIDLAALTPRTLALADAERALLGELLERALISERLRVTNPGAVELLALAYAALTPDAELRAMTLAAATDFLLVAATTAGTRPGWEAEHVAALGALADGGQLADAHAALERRQHEQRQLAAARERRQLERCVEHDALTEQRGAFTQSLKETGDRLHLGRLRGAAPGERTHAKGLADRLARLRTEAAETRSPEALDAVRQRARQPLADAAALLERVAAARGRKAQLAQRLKTARALGNVPKPYRAEADRLRAQLDELRARLPGAHDVELATLEGGAESALAAAADLPARIASDRQQREHAAEQRAQAQRQHDEQRRAQAAAATAQLRHVRAQLTDLDALPRREHAQRPLDALRAATVQGRPLIAYQATAQRPRNLVERYRGQATGTHGWWASPHDPSVHFYGTDSSCDALSTWDAPGVGRVLAAGRVALEREQADLAALTTNVPEPSRPRTRTQRPRPRPAPAPAKRARRAKTKRDREAKAPAAQPERVGCRRCGTTYAARGVLGRRLTCSRCNGPVQPVP